MLSASPVEQKEHKDEEEKKATHPNKSVSHLHDMHFTTDSVCPDSSLTLVQTPTDTPPPLPTTPLPDDYYEEAVPLDPGSTPQYFTTNMNSQYFFLNSLCILHHADITLLQLLGTRWRMPTMKMRTITTPRPGLTVPPKTPVS